jgi:hypothetical protein
MGWRGAFFALLLVLGGALAVVLLLYARTDLVLTDDTADPHLLARADAGANAFSAQIYGYALTEMHRTRQASMDAGNAISRLNRSRALVDCTRTGVVSPNTDTLYTSAFLDLSETPLVLTVPAEAFGDSSYWMVQLLDAYTDAIGYVGQNITRPDQTTFVLFGPGTSEADTCESAAGTVAADALCGSGTGSNGNGTSTSTGASWIGSPTNLVWLLARYLLYNSSDTTRVPALQNQTLLTPFAAYDPSDPVDGPDLVNASYPRYEDETAAAYFQTLNHALDGSWQLDAQQAETGLMASYARAGIGSAESLKLVSAGEVPTLGSIERELAAARALALQRIRFRV